jgi:hypothetical protein
MMLHEREQDLAQIGRGVEACEISKPLEHLAILDSSRIDFVGHDDVVGERMGEPLGTQIGTRSHRSLVGGNHPDESTLA